MSLKSFKILVFHEILKEGILMLFTSVLGHQRFLCLRLHLFNLNNKYVVKNHKICFIFVVLLTFMKCLIHAFCLSHFINKKTKNI